MGGVKSIPHRFLPFTDSFLELHMVELLTRTRGMESEANLKEKTHVAVGEYGRRRVLAVQVFVSLAGLSSLVCLFPNA